MTLTTPVKYIHLMSSTGLQTVVETTPVQAFAKEHLSVAELEDLVNFIATHPDAGDIIQGTGGMRKLRFGAKGKGKSGGIRVITYFYIKDHPVLLIAGFAKGEMENIHQETKNALKEMTAEIKKIYKEKE